MKHIKHNSAKLILIATLLLAIALCVSSALAQPQTVAVVVSEDLTITVPRDEAIELLNLYSRHQLVHEDDIQLYGALRLALGDIGKKDLIYSEGQETWAARKLREWRAAKN